MFRHYKPWIWGNSLFFSLNDSGKRMNTSKGRHQKKINFNHPLLDMSPISDHNTQQAWQHNQFDPQTTGSPMAHLIRSVYVSSTLAEQSFFSPHAFQLSGLKFREGGGGESSAIQSWPLWGFTDELCGADNRVNYLSTTSLSPPPILSLPFSIIVASVLCVAVREVQVDGPHHPLLFTHCRVSTVLAPSPQHFIIVLFLSVRAHTTPDKTTRPWFIQAQQATAASCRGEPNPKKTRPQQPPCFPINTAWVTEQKRLRKSIFKAIDSLMNVEAWGQWTGREPSLWATV